MQLHEVDLSNAPDHPIIDEPWTYEVVALLFQRRVDDLIEPYIDLTLQFGDKIRRLRFLGALNLEVQSSFPYSYSGLEILDVSYLKLDYAKVRVDGYEGYGTIRFWAREVVDVDQLLID